MEKSQMLGKCKYCGVQKGWLSQDDELCYMNPKNAEPQPSTTVKPEWEILKVKGKVIMDILDYTPHYNYDWDKMFEIYSVKRLSDNTVWVIDEIFSNNTAGIYSEEKIKSFEILKDKMKVRTGEGKDNSYYFLEDISKLSHQSSKPVETISSNNDGVDQQ